ncbi:MAG: hypothetical protein V3T20_02220, partial [Gemmatimonadota bacterium]
MTSGEHEARDMMGLDPWGLRRIEKLLLGLEGVGSLKIVPDGHGGIEEIHVLSSSSLGPKQIVRNIESALLAQFGLQIDHRKISIARVRSPEIAAATPAGGTEPQAATSPAPAVSTDRRLVLGNVHIERAAGQTVTCRVDLAHDDSVFTGEAKGPDFEKARMEVAATAALVVTLFVRYPPALDAESFLAFGTLLALSTLAMMLYLRFTEAGSTTSMDFVPELGAILLLGPTGAVMVTLLSELVSGFFLYREKSALKKLFN